MYNDLTQPPILGGWEMSTGQSAVKLRGWKIFIFIYQNGREKYNNTKKQ